ncbi:MAG: hypothetical protein JWQ20_4086 [Conexibacter sp.]|nr:hypothetical protein [Conexibacter sp.]
MTDDTDQLTGGTTGLTAAERSARRIRARQPKTLSASTRLLRDPAPRTRERSSDDGGLTVAPGPAFPMSSEAARWLSAGVLPQNLVPLLGTPTFPEPTHAGESAVPAQPRATAEPVAGAGGVVAGAHRDATEPVTERSSARPARSTEPNALSSPTADTKVDPRAREPVVSSARLGGKAGVARMVDARLPTEPTPHHAEASAAFETGGTAAVMPIAPDVAGPSGIAPGLGVGLVDGARPELIGPAPGRGLPNRATPRPARSAAAAAALRPGASDAHRPGPPGDRSQPPADRRGGPAASDLGQLPVGVAAVAPPPAATSTQIKPEHDGDVRRGRTVHASSESGRGPATTGRGVATHLTRAAALDGVPHPPTVRTTGATATAALPEVSKPNTDADSHRSNEDRGTPPSSRMRDGTGDAADVALSRAGAAAPFSGPERGLPASVTPPPDGSNATARRGTARAVAGLQRVAAASVAMPGGGDTARVGGVSSSEAGVEPAARDTGGAEAEPRELARTDVGQREPLAPAAAATQSTPAASLATEPSATTGLLAAALMVPSPGPPRSPADLRALAPIPGARAASDDPAHVHPPAADGSRARSGSPVAEAPRRGEVGSDLEEGREHAPATGVAAPVAPLAGEPIDPPAKTRRPPTADAPSRPSLARSETSDPADRVGRASTVPAPPAGPTTPIRASDPAARKAADGPAAQDGPGAADAENTPTPIAIRTGPAAGALARAAAESYNRDLTTVPPREPTPQGDATMKRGAIDRRLVPRLAEIATAPATASAATAAATGASVHSGAGPSGASVRGGVSAAPPGAPHVAGLDTATPVARPPFSEPARSSPAQTRSVDHHRPSVTVTMLGSGAPSRLVAPPTPAPTRPTDRPAPSDATADLSRQIARAAGRSDGSPVPPAATVSPGGRDRPILADASHRHWTTVRPVGGPAGGVARMASSAPIQAYAGEASSGPGDAGAPEPDTASPSAADAPVSPTSSEGISADVVATRALRHAASAAPPRSAASAGRRPSRPTVSAPPPVAAAEVARRAGTDPWSFAGPSAVARTAEATTEHVPAPPFPTDDDRVASPRTAATAHHAAPVPATPPTGGSFRVGRVPGGQRLGIATVDGPTTAARPLVTAPALRRALLDADAGLAVQMARTPESGASKLSRVVTTGSWASPVASRHPDAHADPPVGPAPALPAGPEQTVVEARVIPVRSRAALPAGAAAMLAALHAPRRDAGPGEVGATAVDAALASGSALDPAPGSTPDQTEAAALTTAALRHPDLDPSREPAEARLSLDEIYDHVAGRLREELRDDHERRGGNLGTLP